MKTAQLSLRYKNGSLEIERVLYIDGLSDGDEKSDDKKKILIDESFIKWLQSEGLKI